MRQKKSSEASLASSFFPPQIQLRELYVALTFGFAYPSTARHILSGLALRFDDEIGMAAPEVTRHRRSRQEISYQDGRPGQRVKNRFSKNEERRDNPEIESHEEKQNAETQANVLFRHSQELGGQSADDAKRQTMNPGIHGSHLEGAAQMLKRFQASATMEESSSEDSWSVERPVIKDVQDEKPDGDRRRADNTGYDALKVNVGNIRGVLGRES